MNKPFANLDDLFDRRLEPEPNTGCWLWLGSVNNKGYGMTSYHGHAMLVHRLACLLAGHPIESDKEAAHSCDVPRCARPAHLHPSTHQQNMAESVLRGRAAGATQKLTLEQEAVLVALGGTMSQRALAELFGVSQPLVSMILSGRWRARRR